MRRLIKWLTYYKRFNRIKNKIFDRFIKKYPYYPLYDYKTGESHFEKVKLLINYNKYFDEFTGKIKYKTLNIKLFLYISSVTTLITNKNGTVKSSSDSNFYRLQSLYSISNEDKILKLDLIIAKLSNMFRKYKFINVLKGSNKLHLSNNLYAIIVEVPKEETREFLRIVKNEILTPLAKFEDEELPLIIPVHDYET